MMCLVAILVCTIKADGPSKMQERSIKTMEAPELKEVDIIHALTTSNIEHFTEPCVQTRLILRPGKYLLEVWGASGGGKEGVRTSGGYSRGTLTLDDFTEAFVTVASGGLTDSNEVAGTYLAGSCNRGGQARTYGSLSGYWFGCGGGATDVRLNSRHLTSRLIVAGGSGNIHKGGRGGGTEGESGADANSGTGAGQFTGGQ